MTLVARIAIARADLHRSLVGYHWLLKSGDPAVARGAPAGFAGGPEVFLVAISIFGSRR